MGRKVDATLGYRSQFRALHGLIGHHVGVFTTKSTEQVLLLTLVGGEVIDVRTHKRSI